MSDRLLVVVDDVYLRERNDRPSSYAPHKVIYDCTHSPDKVAIIAGGGAGHEPGHATVIGKGMLTAAVSGEIFASPSASQICSGLDLANTDAGVIFVVNR